MKKVIFISICSIFIFFSCSQEPPMAPKAQVSDADIIAEIDAFEKRVGKSKCVSTFTGTSVFVENLDPGEAEVLPNGKVRVRGKINAWYDEATDPRVTGATVWYINALIKEDGSAKLWGTGELEVADDSGHWEMVWRGRKTAEGDIVDWVYGKGTEGAVKGLYGKWKYESEKDPTQPTGFFYNVKGKIFKK